MRKVLAFLFTGLVLWGVYWFAATRLFDEGSYRKQVAFGSVFVPYGWAYALGVILLLALLIFFYSLAYTALVNRLQGRRRKPLAPFPPGHHPPLPLGPDSSRLLPGGPGGGGQL